MLIARGARAWRGAALRRQRWTTSATSGSTSRHTVRRCASLASGYDNADGGSAAAPTPELRVGIVGLGAIGTICFAKLAGVAIAQNAAHVRAATPSFTNGEAYAVPRIAVDAFVKPHHFEKLFNCQAASPFIALHAKVQRVSQDGSIETTAQVAQSIAFTPQRADRVAVAIECANVRIRVLGTDGSNRSEEKQNEGEQPLDVVLVAVKAYDSAPVIQNLQQQHAQLFKRDALFVLLQNGLGELPLDSASDTSVEEEDTSNGDSWRFANGVTYIGGRVLSFANVLVSGFDAAKTCVALVPSSAGDDGQDELATRKLELLGHAMKAAGKYTFMHKYTREM